MDILTITRGATAALGLALASGLVLAGIRFASDRASPVWLARLHGLAAATALLLLAWGAAQALLPGTARAGLAVLLAAAALGLAMSQGWRARGRPLPQGLLFVHLSVAFVGALMVALVALAGGG